MARKPPRIRRTLLGRVSRRRLIVAALLVLAAVLLVLPQAATKRVRSLAGPVFSPLQDLAQGWTLDLVERIRSPRAAARKAGEAADLRTRVDLLEGALAESAARLAEYERRLNDLAQIREGLDGLPCRLIPARLLAPEVAGGLAGARLVGGAEKGVRKGGAVVRCHIDRGKREAIESGEPVLTGAGLVGIVTEVGPVTSTVRLVTDPRSNIMVQVIKRRGGRWRAGPVGLACGTEDGKALRLEHVGRASDVAVGDFVVTIPSPESPLPPYLILGHIVRCEVRPAALYYDLEVEPRVDLSTVREVYVLSIASAEEP